MELLLGWHPCMKVYTSDQVVVGLPYPGKTQSRIVLEAVMGQTEIKEYLRSHGPSTVKELSNSLNLNARGVRESLRSMEKWDEVDRTNTKVAYQADIWGLPDQINELEPNGQEVAANAD